MTTTSPATKEYKLIRREISMLNNYLNNYSKNNVNQLTTTTTTFITKANLAKKLYEDFINKIIGIDWLNIKQLLQNSKYIDEVVTISGILFNFPDLDELQRQLYLPSTLKTILFPYIRYDAINWCSNTSSMFSYCSSLTSIDLSVITSFSKIKNISYWFYGCESLKYLKFPYWTSSEIVKATDSFKMVINSSSTYETLELTIYGNVLNNILSLPDSCLFNTYDLHFEDDILYTITCLKSPIGVELYESFAWSMFKRILDNIKTGNYYFNIYGKLTFDYDKQEENPRTNPLQTNITGLILNDSRLQLPNNISYMFNNCSMIQSININNINNINLNDISYMFYNCSSLNSIFLDSLDGKNITNASHAFHLNLTDTSILLNMICCGSFINRLLSISNSYITPTRNIIFNETDIYNLYCRSSDTPIGSIKIGSLLKWSEILNNILSSDMYTIDYVDNVYTNSTDTTENPRTNQLKNVVLKENQTLIFDTTKTAFPCDFSYMFQDIIERVNFKLIGNGEFITSFDNSFLNSGINDIQMPNFTGNNVKTIENMFYNSKASNISMPNFTGNNVLTALNAFNYCSLSSIDLIEFVGDNITSLESCFANCPNLRSINIPKLSGKNVKSIKHMFYGAILNSLNSLDMRSFKAYYLTDNEDVFYYEYQAIFFYHSFTVIARGMTLKQIGLYLKSYSYNDDTLYSQPCQYNIRYGWKPFADGNPTIL